MKNPAFPVQTSDGCWQLGEDCYESLAEAIQIGMLDFGGCGDSESCLEHVRRALLSVQQGESGYKDCGTLFMRYWLDREGFHEHGCSIGSGYLTKAGEKLLEMLNVLAKDWKVEA